MTSDMSAEDGATDESPATDGLGRLPADPDAKTQQNRRAAQRIALVARDSLTCEMLQQWLQELGRHVRIDRHPADTLLADAPSGDRRADRYDLIVVECDWNGGTEEAASDQLRLLAGTWPGTPVVVVSDSQHPSAIMRALEQGVRGYIPTSFEPLVATAALHLVLSGGVFAPVMPFLPDPPAPGEDGPRNRKGAPPDPSPSPSGGAGGRDADSAMLDAAVERLGFTVREAEILALLQRGRPNRQIATELGISENTVMVHIRHLMKKLGATNRTQAVFQALRLLSEKSSP